MKKLIFSCFTALCSLLYTTSSYAQQNWIVGGQLATEGQFPFVGDLRYFDTYHFCGGALINEKWVLTAAHCMADPFGSSNDPVNPSSLAVRFNSINTEGTLNSNGGVKTDVEAIFIHSGFDVNNPDLNEGNDIALLKLSTPIYSINPIPLAKYEDTATVYATNQPVLIAGWGLEIGSPQFQTSDILKYCLTKVVSRTNCESLFGSLSHNVFCAGYTTGEPENGAGQGDSGGPVWVEENNNKKLIGVVSGGLDEITKENRPGIYTKVAKYYNWIDSVMTTNGSTLSISNAVSKQADIQTKISSTTLHVTFLAPIEAAVYAQVYDAAGREVYQATWEKPANGSMQQIPISALSNGIYILKLQASNHRLDYNDKFIIHQ